MKYEGFNHDRQHLAIRNWLADVDIVAVVDHDAVDADNILLVTKQRVQCLSQHLRHIVMDDHDEWIIPLQQLGHALVQSLCIFLHLLKARALLPFHGDRDSLQIIVQLEPIQLVGDSLSLLPDSSAAASFKIGIFLIGKLSSVYVIVLPLISVV